MDGRDQETDDARRAWLDHLFFFLPSFPGATRARPASVTKPYMQNVRSGRAVDARTTGCSLFSSTAASDGPREELLSWNREAQLRNSASARMPLPRNASFPPAVKRGWEGEMTKTSRDVIRERH